jgi:hypothetical protein
MRRTLYSASALAASIVALGVLASSAAAQTKAPGPREGEVASDPIRCWWKADRTAVRVGERFGLVLTCSVIETGAITVVPALNQLEPGALSITPFEVVSGTRGEDVVVPPWRYVQFDYTVRLLSDGFFGQDLMIPALTVTYNLQSAGGTQGRDKTYVLPALPIRVLSLAPRSASDIRDASGQTFATIASRRFRSSLAFVLAWISFAFAVVLAAFAVMSAVRHYRLRGPAAVRVLPASSVLGGCLNALRDVAGEATRAGWSPELARRAVAALRIAGALAIERPVAQSFADRDTSEREGQIAVRTGWFKPQRVLISAAVTSKAIAGHLENGRIGAGARTRLESLADALSTLSVASYGRNGKPDAGSLDAAIESGRTAVQGLRTSARWPVRTASAVMRMFTFGG